MKFETFNPEQPELRPVVDALTQAFERVVGRHTGPTFMLNPGNRRPETVETHTPIDLLAMTVLSTVTNELSTDSPAEAAETLDLMIGEFERYRNILESCEDAMRHLRDKAEAIALRDQTINGT